MRWQVSLLLLRGSFHPFSGRYNPIFFCYFCIYLIISSFHVLLLSLCRQGEKFSTWPTTDVKLGRSSHWVGTRTGACCHHHTSAKLFWSQPTAPWQSVATYGCANAHVHGSMGCDQESFPLVWQWHQLLSRSQCNGLLSKFHIGCSLGQELFTLPSHVLQMCNHFCSLHVHPTSVIWIFICRDH